MAGKKAKNKQHYTVGAVLKVDDIPKAGAAATFVVKDGSGKIGAIQIGQGSFRWKGKSGHKYKSIAWSKFFARLEDG